MECSDIEDSEFSECEGSEPGEKEIEISSDNISDISDISDKENESSENKPENILSVRKRRRARVCSSSESEIESVQASRNEIAKDGTRWQRIQEGSPSGRSPLHNIFKDTSGPTGYAKKSITKDKVISAFSLLIDSHMLQRIISCTESEASRVLGKKWTLTETRLKAFLGILYARGAYEAKNLKLSYLWNTKWGPSFFSSAMSRNEFFEILKFIRFDKKDDRSRPLKNDKFALTSTVWDKFIENSQNCYKPGVNVTTDEEFFPIKAEFYNKTKFGVHIADRMTKKYSVKLKSKRWSLQVFFNILDLAGINAWILYKETTGEQIPRKNFMLQLADELAADNEKLRIEQRASKIQSTSKNSPYSRKWCQIRYCNNNKTTIICNLCKKYVCGKCTQKKVYVCKKCNKW